MANERAEELRNMDIDELEIRLAEQKQTLFNLRFQNVTGQLDNSSRLGEVRRDVARIRTILRQREIEAAEAPGAQGPEQPQERGNGPEPETPDTSEMSEHVDV
jgi:large subunit ribosomal protein L29